MRHEPARCGGACALYPLVLPGRCSVDGLQISNFRPACVRANPLVKQFYAAVDAGAHEAFVHQPGLWWGCPNPNPNPNPYPNPNSNPNPNPNPNPKVGLFDRGRLSGRAAQDRSQLPDRAQRLRRHE